MSVRIHCLTCLASVPSAPGAAGEQPPKHGWSPAAAKHRQQGPFPALDMVPSSLGGEMFMHPQCKPWPDIARGSLLSASLSCTVLAPDFVSTNF